MSYYCKAYSYKNKMQEGAGGRGECVSQITDHFRAFWKTSKQTKMKVSPKCRAKDTSCQLRRTNHCKSSRLPPYRESCSARDCRNSAVLSVHLRLPSSGASGTQVAAVGHASGRVSSLCELQVALRGRGNLDVCALISAPHQAALVPAL